MMAAARVSSARDRLTGSLILHVASQCEWRGVAWDTRLPFRQEESVARSMLAL